jgi:hypothetical protein
LDFAAPGRSCCATGSAYAIWIFDNWTVAAQALGWTGRDGEIAKISSRNDIGIERSRGARGIAPVPGQKSRRPPARSRYRHRQSSHHRVDARFVAPDPQEISNCARPARYGEVFQHVSTGNT